MPIYKLKLVNRREIARNTMVFDFEKPEGFTFIPGQYGGFTLINPAETDAGGITRRFSLMSTPDDKHISVVTRIQQSAFKRVLKELPDGSEVKFAGPTGNFVLHEDKSIPAVFIAGGIGLAPFYSIIRHATHQRSHQKITLFYGNLTTADSAFLPELMQIESENPNFKMIAVMSGEDTSWNGEKGFITDDLIHKNVKDLTTPIFYVCGSPAMVNALHNTLKELDINEDWIKVEDFPGY